MIDLKGRDHLSSITANIEQLLEVLLELINNAKNALLKRGGVIELRVEQGDDQIAISVKDNGPGIPKEFMEHLFQNQVSSKSGSGLGLFLCKKVVSTLGGSLILQDSSDEGTEFRILLPISGDDTKEH
jgi:two-component system NtrC family sensor kinase